MKNDDKFIFIKAQFREEISLTFHNGIDKENFSAMSIREYFRKINGADR